MDSRKERLVGVLALVAEELTQLAKNWHGREAETERRIGVIASETIALRDELVEAVNMPLDPETASDVMTIVEDINEAVDSAKNPHLADDIRVQSGRLSTTAFSLGIAVSDHGWIFTDERKS